MLTIAHRGASREAPENTLAAVRRAVAHRADLVEVDVQRSRDGALVLMHDTTLVRTTDATRVFPRRAPWRVGDFTLDELRSVDAGSWFSPAYAGEQVPTLQEAAAALAGSGTGLLVELKMPGLYPGVVADLVADLVGVLRILPVDRVVVQSFDIPAVKEHKTLLPAVPVAVLGAPPAAHLPVLGSWADQLNPPHLAARRRYVEAVHRAGMTCHPWTVDAPWVMRRLRGHGVDGVITNRPHLRWTHADRLSEQDRRGQRALR